eukprot:g14677.t1
MHPAPFQQAFHGATTGAYEDSINLHSFELALNDVAGGGDLPDPSAASVDPAEERASPEECPRPARRGSILVSAPSPADAVAEAASSAPRDGGEEHGQGEATTSSSSSRQSVYRQSSAHRLFRAAPPEPKQQQWCAPHASSDDSSGGVAAPSSGGDSRLRASSWNSDSRQHRQSPPPPPPGLGADYNSNSSDRFFPKRRGRDDKEIMDGSDVLQQISNLTSTQPSNEREVFVGGLRESEDAVHITEEELATYFAKFGVIESVSINRDDRTQRGRGFAFVKFFQESAALNAVVADASTHVIRGTTVSVQWSRGAKDAGNGDRPRRRNSGSNASSGNGNSPPRGGGRSSSKMGMFPHKGGGGRSGGGGGACGVGSSHGFSPMRSRGAGHMHAAPAGAGGAGPYGYGGGGGHGDHNQRMVCVVVPAQRAAALGLAPHPPHHLHSPGAVTLRGSPPQDTHFSPLAQSGGGGHAGYPFHTRSHSHGHGGGVGGGGGGYGVDHHLSSLHHVSPSSGHHLSPSSSHHTSPSSGHHVSPNAGRSCGGAPSMHMPPIMHREGRGRAEPRDYPSPANAGGGGGGSASYAEYERSMQQQQPEPAASYVMPEWGYDDSGSSRGGHAAVAAPSHNVIRSQSPPANMRRSTLHTVFGGGGGGGGGRNGGGAPRPPSASPRAYDGHYSSTRYNARGADGFSVAGISSGGVAMRRRSESSAMIGRSSIQRDALAAAASYHNSVDDMGKDDAMYGRDYGLGYGGPPPGLP